MENKIDYPRLVHQAMLNMVAGVLRRVSEDGLPGEHHFYVTFSTQHPQVDLPPHLLEQNPETMTIVMQHWFQDLVVTEQDFSVVLSFDNSPHMITVPYDAILSFIDPSCEFGLEFQPKPPEEVEIEAECPMIEIENSVPDTELKQGTGDKVVRLDAFRKQAPKRK